MNNKISVKWYALDVQQLSLLSTKHASHYLVVIVTALSSVAPI
jgi:hypothetical protein